MFYFFKVKDICIPWCLGHNPGNLSWLKFSFYHILYAGWFYRLCPQTPTWWNICALSLAYAVPPSLWLCGHCNSPCTWSSGPDSILRIKNKQWSPWTASQSCHSLRLNTRGHHASLSTFLLLKHLYPLIPLQFLWDSMSAPITVASSLSNHLLRICSQLPHTCSVPVTCSDYLLCHSPNTLIPSTKVGVGNTTGNKKSQKLRFHGVYIMVELTVSTAIYLFISCFSCF